jgi:methylase of polypeptide subunit release factors
MGALDLNALGCAERFDDLLQFLRSADYTDAFICKRFQLERAEDFELDRKKRPLLPPPESAADILLHLFLAGEMVAPALANQRLGIENVRLLREMGLLNEEDTSERLYGSVALYPVEDLYIASDRWSTPDGSQLAGPEDTVYPAFIPNTRLFIRHLPQKTGARFLDLCAGTGIAAIRAAVQGAVQACSGDIAVRSSRFAEFNRRLNGTSNVLVVTSDLYQNVDGGFDVISAHPPYVPSLQPKWIFFSGGRDGEEITRRIIGGLPDHLNDGGQFIALAMGGDRAGQPFECRIREWLGPRHTEFDIALIVRKELDPREFALRANRETIRTREESERWNELFQTLQVESLAYGFICIQRRSSAHSTFTIRRQVSTKAARAPWEWLLRWEAAVHEGRLQELILDAPLRASQKTEFEVLHRLDQGLWSPSNYRLRTDYPFSVECEAQPWMAHVISLCDGVTTGRDVLQTLVQHGLFPESTQELEFAQAVASLVSGGFIEVVDR